MGNRLAVATRKGLFLYADQGNGDWKLIESSLLGDPVTLVHIDHHGYLHAAIEHGHFGIKISRSTDGGANWDERSVPQYPPKPDDEEDLDPIRNLLIPWDVKRIWALESTDRNGIDEMWCGTIPGGLFYSSDGGNNWSLVDSLWNHPERKRWFGGGADYPGIHSIVLDPDDAQTLRVGVSCGGVWISEDNGNNWRCEGEGLRAEYVPPELINDPGIQDPHCLVQCAGEGDRLWIQHHNGIFRSDDRGKNWNEITDVDPSVFGFPVAVHPTDPDSAWFVPAIRDDQRYPVDGRVVVTRTRDGGKHFETLTRGLPQQDAYDLVYRHALDIDHGGNCLAFGSTTGNFWLSENQGDDWMTLSNNLPPIYAVRFYQGPA